MNLVANRSAWTSVSALFAALFLCVMASLADEKQKPGPQQPQRDPSTQVDAPGDSGADDPSEAEEAPTVITIRPAAGDSSQAGSPPKRSRPAPFVAPRQTAKKTPSIVQTAAETEFEPDSQSAASTQLKVRLPTSADAKKTKAGANAKSPKENAPKEPPAAPPAAKPASKTKLPKASPLPKTSRLPKTTAPAETDPPAETEPGTPPEPGSPPEPGKPSETKQTAGIVQPEIEILTAGLETTEEVAAEAAQLKGIQPGVTTDAQLAEIWGEAVRIDRQQGFERHTYQLQPFKEVLVTTRQGKVTSIAVRFQQSFEAPQLARDLSLDTFEAVIVADDAGELLGQVYPERGVLFTFEPGNGESLVQQIVLEEIDAEPFVLRAEANWQRDYRHALADLKLAEKLAPDFIRAQWLQARVLAASGQSGEALTTIDRVLKHEPQNAEFRLTRAAALEKHGDFGGAMSEYRKIMAITEAPEYVRAAAMIHLGDLIANGPGRDYKRALEMHQGAIKLAEPLLADRNLEIRQATQAVLIDAHLAMALDIAWGRWKNKDRVVPKWLDQAKTLAEAMASNDWTKTDYQFRIARSALSAHVGMQHPLPDDHWAEATLTAGQQLVASTTDPVRQQQLEWELGTALHDALQVYLMMGKFDPALKYGSLAIRHLERGSEPQKKNPASGYMMARCYFRVGSIYAMHFQDHRQAAVWFDKAVPLLEGPVPVSALADIGRKGETLVSIGVSYWETGKRPEALRVTQRGLELMERAVEDEILPAAALTVPYANLAGMHRFLGEEDKARGFERMASERQDTIKK